MEMQKKDHALSYMQQGLHANVANEQIQNFSIKLTTRGRFVLGFLISAVVLFGSFFITQQNATEAVATAQNGASDIRYVLPQQGDTLWAVALSLAPDVDPRDTVAELMKFNNLESAQLQAFEPIAVPAKYASAENTLTAAEVGR